MAKGTSSIFRDKFMKPTVFIHTNDKQILGAKLAEYAFKNKSASPDAFDVKLIRLEETDHLYKREGHSYLRKGKSAVWKNNDLQSFSPLRMLVPQLMNYQGKALLVDPDVFALGDVYDLLNMDMNGKAIICRHVPGGYRGNGNPYYATSVMLLDCEKLKHWKWNDHIDMLFNKTMDYGDWISLKNENPKTIGALGAEWNDFDTLTPQTKLLHTTERMTQPWRTGLPVDFDTTTQKQSSNQSRAHKVKQLVKSLFGLGSLQKQDQEQVYLQHPDLNQERFILKLIKDALNSGVVTETYLNEEINNSNLRKDIFLKLGQI
jgi:hypothetical protein